jgi:hypothetical protein
MRRAIAAFLRHRGAWQLVAIAAGCTIVGLYVIYNSYSSTLRQISGLLTVLFAIGGAALILAIVRRDEQIKQAGGPAAAMWLRFVAAIVGLAAAIAYVTYSFGHFHRHMLAGCGSALLPERYEERKAALAEAEARLASPFALLPGLLSDQAARKCAYSRADLARVDQGLCTDRTLVDRPCACGAERYPYARCDEPRCLYEPGLPDRFDCPGDPAPEGYSHF